MALLLLFQTSSPLSRPHRLFSIDVVIDVAVVWSLHLVHGFYLPRFTSIRCCGFDSLTLVSLPSPPPSLVSTSSPCSHFNPSPLLPHLNTPALVSTPLTLISMPSSSPSPSSPNHCRSLSSSLRWWQCGCYSSSSFEVRWWWCGCYSSYLSWRW
jgi:hypothetical protein